MFICVTHVDSKTKVQCNKAPMVNGPSFPNVKGLNIEWWDQSRWPLTHPDDFPRFYGTCDDDADTSISGVISVLTEEDYNNLKNQEEKARLPSLVSMKQARLALLKAGLLQDVVDALNTLPEATREAAKIEWEFAQDVYKDSPLVKQLQEALQLTDQEIDDLFVSASNIRFDDFVLKEE